MSESVTNEKAEICVHPRQREQQLTEVLAGPLRRLARWPWLETHLRMQAGKKVSPFHARLTRESLQLMGGRLARKIAPKDQLERVKWKSEWEDRTHWEDSDG